jgi:hypothetical protein
MLQIAEHFPLQKQWVAPDKQDSRKLAYFWLFREQGLGSSTPIGVPAGTPRRRKERMVGHAVSNPPEHK